MRLGTEGYPLIILSHRKQEFLETTVASIREHAHGITDVIVVDDSGDPEHHAWLDDHGYQFTVVDHDRNLGYLEAMRKVWETARAEAYFRGLDYVMLWEEDFLLTRPLHLSDMVAVMNHPLNQAVVQLNLQRQPVYRVERRWGYLESHDRRGYSLVERKTDGVPWVQRHRPFTTNPGLIRVGALLEPWPHREICDREPGGAEPAMSRVLERRGWTFGWLGEWNAPHTQHVGTAMKTGSGY